MCIRGSGVRGGRLRPGPLFHAPLAASALLLVACAGEGAPAAEADPGADSGPVDSTASDSVGLAASGSEVRPERIESEWTSGDTVPGWPSWTREDLAVLESTVAWAREEGLDSLPIGERVARIGERFVGAPYIPQTLDPRGPERLVVNLRAFDCVTFVESVLALAHVVTSAGAASTTTAGRGPGDPGDGGSAAARPRSPERPDDASGVDGGSEALMAAFEEVLTSLRYRAGRLAGYPSRLHYFSEWIADNETKGFVRDVSADLGGVRDPEPPTFMTEHRDAYWQLADPATFEAVREMEAHLADAPRHVIPEERVIGVEDRIRSGDVIAATSTLAGLDVAHTGIAIRRGGVLHLMHAPLVGEAVQISGSSLGERLLGLSAQDGIMVARPQPVPDAGSSLNR